MSSRLLWTARVPSLSVLVLLLLALGAGAGPAPARQPPPLAPSPPPDRIAELEGEFLTLKSRGRYEESLVPLRAALDLALDGALPPGEAPRPLEARLQGATAEVLLLAADRIVRILDAYALGLEILGDVAARPGLDPLLRARVEQLRALYRRALGRDDHEWAPREGAGFLADWLLVGPFDNEQGSGFDRPDPPEREFDPGAAYDAKGGGEVGWRRVPDGSRAYVILGLLMDPTDQALAYAATTIRCPQGMKVAFRAGSSGGIRIWVDGRLLLSRAVRRSAELDQDAFGAALDAGIHHILVKSTHRTGPWGFVLRITDPEGRPLEGVACSADPGAVGEAFAAAHAPDRSAPEPCPVDEGAAAFFRDYLETHSSDARAYFHAALLHLLVGGDDPSEGVARKLAARAVELEPRNPHARYLLALASAPPIKMRPELEQNELRRHLEECLRIDPEHAEAAVMLAGYSMDSIRIPDRALAYCDRALAVNPDLAQARVLRGRILAAKGLDGLAAWEVARLGGPATEAAPESRLARARLAADQGRLGEAASLVRRALEADRTDRVLRGFLIDIERDRGETEAARALYDEALRQEPLDVGAMAGRADLLESMGRLDEALGDLDRALEISPRKPSLWKARATILHRMDREKEALAAMRRAQGLDPSDRWSERYLELLEKEARPFEDAFPFDTEGLLAEAKDLAPEPQAPYRYLLWRTVVKLEADGTASRFQHLVVEALDQEGARALLRIPLGYFPESQRLRLRFARVRKPGGQVLRGTLGPVSGRGGEGRGAVRQVEMPVVEPGDVVEVAYRIDDVRASLFGRYFGDMIYFQRGDLLPVHRSILTLIAPEDLPLLVRERNGAPEPRTGPGDAKGTVARTWEMQDLPRVEREPFMPPVAEFLPVVEVSTYRSWDEFAQWWWSLIEKEFTVSEGMQDLVDRVASATTSRLERLRRIYDFVATRIRYVAWEFGIHGYQPYSAATIFARKFGDCKDKSILLRTLLERLGIPSYPVVLRADSFKGRQDLDSPLIEHFNHCIVYVPLEDDWEGDPFGRGLFLDGTAQYNDWRALPSPDRGGGALVVHGPRATVVEIPDPPPEENRLDADEIVRVHPDGSADVRGTVRARGAVAAEIRNLFENPGERKERIASRFTPRFGQVEVLSMRFSDLQDLETPVEYGYEVRIPTFLTRGDIDFTAPILFSAPTYSQYVTLQGRKFDLLLQAVHSWGASVTFELDPPLQAAVYFDDLDLDNDFSTFHLSTSKRGRVVAVEASLATKKRRIPAERYPEFREFAQQVDEAAREVIHVDRR